MEIYLAHTQGFCAGVAMAIDVVEKALDLYGTPLYVRHHIVHNTSVIDDFKKKGVVFIETLADVPSNSTVIFSAHGTAPEIYDEAKKRGLSVIDATCPLVKKVHRHALRFSDRSIQTILIGHKGHQELEGTSGYVNDNLLYVVEDEADIDRLDINRDLPVGYLTQTTLSVSDTAHLIKKLKQRYPDIQGSAKADICYATQNRQDAVVELTDFCDLIIVCGSAHSSNSNRLKETAEKKGVLAYIIDTCEELDVGWVKNKKKVGITSGASVPRYIVDKVVEKIKQVYSEAVVFEEETREKGIFFALPKELDQSKTINVN